MRRVLLSLSCAACCLACTLVPAGPDASSSFLVRVERQHRDDLTDLLSRDVPVVIETRHALFVEGGSDSLEQLRQLGRTFSVLDTDAGAWDFWIVALRPDSDTEAVEAAGAVLLREENWVVLRVPRETPQALLAPARVFVGRIPHEPMQMPRPRTQADPGADYAATADPLVQKIVDAVLPADIDQLWNDLTANPPSGTRFSTAQGCRDAATYCYDHYTALGIPAAYQEFNPAHAPNVIGTLEGALHPGDVYIVEGHLDDLPSTGPAPGADDNASGSVVVLESAKVMACYAFKNTVKFLNVTGEEQGLYGSEAYADDAWARGENILGVINMDMPGWEGDGIPVQENLDVNYNTPSEWLGLLFADCASRYATGLAVDAFYCPSLTASDHWPFWQKGWSAICGITDNEGYCGHGGNYPHYHTSDDTIANCGDPTFFYSVVKTSVATLAELAEPFKVTMGSPAFACGAGVAITVGDRDLDTDPGLAETVEVEVWSDSEPTPETLTLTERDISSMLFDGTIPTTAGPPVAADGVLSTAPGDTVFARYVDALDCDGATAVPYTSTATIDCTAPLISGVGETGVSDTQATITWTTDEAASSTVHWGETPPPAATETQAGMTTAHSVTLTGLQSCTVYYYSVESGDVAGNVAVDDSGGQFYHFETLGDFGQGLQPCHAGSVTIGAATHSCSDTVSLQLVDIDLNPDPGVAETATLRLTSSTETEPELVTVQETGPNTSTFTGTIATAAGPPVADGVLQVAGGDVLTATYLDADDGTGTPATAFATADLDCSGPVIRDLRVTDVTDQRLTVRFETDEPGDTVVDWGPTPALGDRIVQPALTTTHAVTINRLGICQPLYLRVSSSDDQGNGSVFDLAGAPYAAHTWTVPGLYWQETFEGGGAGWTLQGEWEIGTPAGLGGSTGAPDPTSAYNNRNALGHDLSGLGAWPGDYEPLTNELARSPVHDATGWTNTSLLYRRRLQTDAADSAALWLWTGGVGRPIFLSGGQTYQDGAYVLVKLDISSLADGSPAVYLEFRQQANSGLQRSGWNVDDVIFKDGTLPDHGPCGGCLAAPSFGGARAAVDDDACGSGGVTVFWEAAVSWGSGGPGTYAVYRDSAPGFTPSAANRIASGVAGLSFTDLTAPTDQTLHYLVRAESDEGCGGGPNNGGLTDDNQSYVAVDETSTRPLPGPVAGLAVEMVNHAHARLSWTAEAAAATYRIYRSTAPDAGFVLLAEVPGQVFEDLGQGGNANSFYYRVSAVNACGQEGP